MTGKIAFLTWGNGSQVRSFHDFTHLLDDMIYLPDLASHDLGRYAAVVLPDGMSPAAVRPHAKVLNDYARGGGCLVGVALAVYRCEPELAAQLRALRRKKSV